MKKALIIGISIIAIMFLTTVYYFNFLPDTIASHWNQFGQADGFSSKGMIFLIPGLSILILGIFWALPIIDPMKQNLKHFKEYYEGFIILIISFLFYVHLLSLLFNTGAEINVSKYMMPALAVLIFYVGILLGKAKQNWFIGIRTPWTLSHPKVWEETHYIGSILFKFKALIILFAFFFPEHILPIVIVPIIVSSIFLVLFSYYSYTKVK